jgi:hypothetical protein
MEWMNSVVAGLISGLITGTLTCWVFYWLAGRDLKREANDLRKLNILTIRALVQAGLAEVNVDAQGNPVGLRYTLKAESGTFTLSGSVADLRVHRKPPDGGTPPSPPEPTP